MAQNITLMGASYTDVPSVELPKTGGGTASFTDTSPTTAAASDVASGKYFFTANGVLTLGTSSGGGGGASNVVTGTFKGTTTGAAMDVTLAYTGSGYPIAVVIYPKDGPYNNSDTFYELVQRYAIAQWVMVKSSTSTAPEYIAGTTNKDYGCTLVTYKSSTSSATQYSRTSSTAATSYYDVAAVSQANNAVRFRSATKMTVFIASSSYGFAANIEYRYWVLYSS